MTTSIPTPRSVSAPCASSGAYSQDNVRLVNVVRAQLGLPPRTDLIPSAENLEAFLGGLP